MLNIDNARSYATEALLLKALARLNLADRKPVIACNRRGRFTAVFGLHLSKAGADICGIARLGFLVID